MIEAQTISEQRKLSKGQIRRVGHSQKSILASRPLLCTVSQPTQLQIRQMIMLHQYPINIPLNMPLQKKKKA